MAACGDAFTLAIGSGGYHLLCTILVVKAIHSFTRLILYFSAMTALAEVYRMFCGNKVNKKRLLNQANSFLTQYRSSPKGQEMLRVGI